MVIFSLIYLCVNGVKVCVPPFGVRLPDAPDTFVQLEPLFEYRTTHVVKVPPVTTTLLTVLAVP